MEELVSKTKQILSETSSTIEEKGESLSLPFREMRNKFVDQDSKEVVLGDCSFLSLLIFFLEEVCSLPLDPNSSLFKTFVLCLQMICNLVTASPKAQTIVWEKTFPNLHQTILRKFKHPQVQMGVLLMVHNSTISNPPLLQLLVQQHEEFLIFFVPVLKMFLHVLAHDGCSLDVTELGTYIFQSVFKSSDFPSFFLSLSSLSGQQEKLETLLFLELLEAILLLEHQSTKIEEDFDFLNGNFSLLSLENTKFLVKELCDLFSKIQTNIKLGAAKKKEKREEEGEERKIEEEGKEKEGKLFKTKEEEKEEEAEEKVEEQKETKQKYNKNEIETLVLFLRIFGTISSNCNLLFREKMVKNGLLELCVFVLQMAVEIEGPTNETKKDQKTSNSSFFGIKGTAIRIIGNLCYQNQVAQDMVRELGGLQVVLSQCGVDDNNPLIREWSILAIRNLTINNVENQQFIQEMNPVKVMESPELQKMGLSAELSGGKVKIKNAGQL